MMRTVGFALLVLLCCCVFRSSAAATKDEHIDVTLIHLTDVHGWIYGHPHEEGLDATFGDFKSLLSHMNANLDDNDDLWVFDTGDLVEGTGLSDATRVHGQDIFPIMREIPYDGATIGNHDVGHNSTVDALTSEFVNKLDSGVYITTNTLNAVTGDTIGECYNVVKAAKGFRILVLGFMYDFNQNSENTEVVYMKQALKSKCFKKAMKLGNIDMIVTLNHIDPQSQNDTLRLQYNAIRAAYPDAPYIMLTGHRHVMYYEDYDENCFTIESGRYFEELGVIRFTLYRDPEGVAHWDEPTYQWMQTTKEKFIALAQQSPDTFDTKDGLALDNKIQGYWKELGLGRKVGCAPMTYVPYNYIAEPDSFYNLLVHHIVTYNFDYSDEKYGSPFFCTNAFALRDNLYEGKVVVNDLYSISPFNDTYYFFPNLTGSHLIQLITYLNQPDDDLRNKQHDEIVNLHKQKSHVVQTQIERAQWGETSKRELAQSIQQHIHHYQSDATKSSLANINGKMVDPFASSSTSNKNKKKQQGGPSPPPNERYWCTSLDIEADRDYMLVAAEYDSFVIMNALNDLFPNDPVSSPAIFIGPHGRLPSTALLDIYIQDKMPCPDEEQL